MGRRTSVVRDESLGFLHVLGSLSMLLKILLLGMCLVRVVFLVTQGLAAILVSSFGSSLGTCLLMIRLSILQLEILISIITFIFFILRLIFYLFTIFLVFHF